MPLAPTKPLTSAGPTRRRTPEGERELAVQRAGYPLRRFGVTAREVDAITQALRRRADAGTSG